MAAFNTFACGCRKPNLHTLRLCEWAKLKGIECPEFMITEDCTNRKIYDLLRCVEHS